MFPLLAVFVVGGHPGMLMGFLWGYSGVSVFGGDLDLVRCGVCSVAVGDCK